MRDGDCEARMECIRPDLLLPLVELMSVVTFPIQTLIWRVLQSMIEWDERSGRNIIFGVFEEPRVREVLECMARDADGANSDEISEFLSKLSPE
jgi:hypothetical protein